MSRPVSFVKSDSFLSRPEDKLSQQSQSNLDDPLTVLQSSLHSTICQAMGLDGPVVNEIAPHPPNNSLPKHVLHVHTRRPAFDPKSTLGSPTETNAYSSQMRRFHIKQQTESAARTKAQ